METPGLGKRLPFQGQDRPQPDIEFGPGPVRRRQAHPHQHVQRPAPLAAGILARHDLSAAGEPRNQRRTYSGPRFAFNRHGPLLPRSQRHPDLSLCADAHQPHLFLMPFFGGQTLPGTGQGGPLPDADPGAVAKTPLLGAKCRGTPLPWPSCSARNSCWASFWAGHPLHLCRHPDRRAAHRLPDGFRHGQRGGPGFRRIRGGHGPFSVHGQFADIPVHQRTPVPAERADAEL
jgi:hypothetical protein